MTLCHNTKMKMKSSLSASSRNLVAFSKFYLQELIVSKDFSTKSNTIRCTLEKIYIYKIQQKKITIFIQFLMAVVYIAKLLNVVALVVKEEKKEKKKRGSQASMVSYTVNFWCQLIHMKNFHGIRETFPYIQSSNRQIYRELIEFKPSNHVNH